jgi:DNA-binding transcriptional MocR family regulator
MLKYLGLYERYKGLIHSGTYAPGERLPSLRAVAEEEGLGLNTVRSAFGLLEAEGLARPLERGGYYVGRGSGRATGTSALEGYASPRDCRETEGLSASRKIEYLLAAGGASRNGSVAGFALAEPDSSLLPVARLERLLGSLSGNWIEYGEGEGEGELRRRIAASCHPYHGNLDSEGILVTNGATEAISVAVRAFVEPGDSVVVESPTYYDYFRQLAAARAKIVEIPLRRSSRQGGAARAGIDLDLLESRLKRQEIKMIIVQPNVQNPTGAIMGDEDKARLVALAAKSGSILVQDDVYGDLAFSRERPRNLGAFGDYERSVYLTSFSKSLAPGLRIGWMYAPGLAEGLKRTKSLSSLSTNRASQRAIADYLAGPAFKKHLIAMRASLEAQLEDYLGLLSDALPEGSTLMRPSGGCLLWIALPKGVDASELFESAARMGILFAPGELFSANPFFRGHMRINFGYRLGDKRRAELGRLCDLARDAV